MRTEFERAGVWELLRKRIAASEYTRPGDPLRIDVGYRPNGLIRMFHAVSLEPGVEMAKVLAFSAAGLRAGRGAGGEGATGADRGDRAGGQAGSNATRSRNGWRCTGLAWRRWKSTRSGC